MVANPQLSGTSSPAVKKSGVGPAIALFFTAPLVAEFLLGNLPIKLLPALIVLAPMYGGGALLIRESVRRSRHGWRSIFLLGVAYAILEEAFTTQSLFNPDYLHLHLGLLQPAYIPALGIGGWWTLWMLNIHPIWSIAVPIALIEATVPGRSGTPWLGRTGYVVTCGLFAFGIVMLTRMSYRRDHFLASPAQFAGAAIVLLFFAVAAFFLQRKAPADGSGWTRNRERNWVPGSIPGPWVTGALALVAGSAALLIPKGWGWWAVTTLLALDLSMLFAVFTWSRRIWTAQHKLALAAGAAMAYAWHSFLQVPAVGGMNMSVRIGNAIFTLAAIGLIAFAAKRSSGAMQTSHNPGAPS
jgi:hypothetical protein